MSACKCLVFECNVWEIWLVYCIWTLQWLYNWKDLEVQGGIILKKAVQKKLVQAATITEYYYSFAVSYSWGPMFAEGQSSKFHVLILQMHAIMPIIHSMVCLFCRFNYHNLPIIHKLNTQTIFSKFANCFGFQHVTSSPWYPQNKCQVERMVPTMKRMIHKSDDPHLAIMSYWATLIRGARGGRCSHGTVAGSLVHILLLQLPA